MAQELFIVLQERTATVFELLIHPDMDVLLFDALIDSISTHLDARTGWAWVLDLSKINYLSSAGLGLLVNIRQKVRKGNGKLALCGLSPKLMELFRSCCLERLFLIEATRPKALAALSRK